MIEETLTITNKLGLHVRASSLLVKQAGKHLSQIYITHAKTDEKAGKRVNAKSILAVMTLGAKQGDQLTLTIDGTDEIAAMQDIKNLINNKFGESE